MRETEGVSTPTWPPSRPNLATQEAENRDGSTRNGMLTGWPITSRRSAGVSGSSGSAVHGGYGVRLKARACRSRWSRV